MEFAGYKAGITGTRRYFPTAVMAATAGILIVMVIDLDRPSRGFMRVPVHPLVDALQGIPQ